MANTAMAALAKKSVIELSARPTRYGFASLAVLWLYTGFRACVSIRKGAVVDHNKWMLRNFALTFAAVTLRIYLPISMLIGLEFSATYPVIAWLCWVPNIAFVEWRRGWLMQTEKTGNSK